MKLSEIAEILNKSYHGKDVDVNRVGSMETSSPDEILYVENAKYLEKAIAKKPAALIIPNGLSVEDIPYIEADDPKFIFIKLLNIFNPYKPDNQPCIEKESVISAGADIGKDVTIMPGAVVQDGAEVGDNCVIYPNCVLEKGCSIGPGTVLYSGTIIRQGCEVGAECIIHSGAVIGADGYGFYEKDEEMIKIPQIGIVKIGDRVEIGANCTIDRATVDKTVIGNDTKIDNLIHIAHNVKIGEKCLIAAQAGISGSTTIGNHVIILGQVGIADHLTIADNTIIMPQSGIHNDIKKADLLFGTPARPVKEHHRIFAALKFLPGLLKRVKLLEDELANSR